MNKRSLSVLPPFGDRVGGNPAYRYPKNFKDLPTPVLPLPPRTVSHKESFTHTSPPTPTTILSSRCLIYPHSTIVFIKFPSLKQLRGAAEARRAHNPEVTRSKRVAANFLHLFFPLLFLLLSWDFLSFVLLSFPQSHIWIQLVHQPNLHRYLLVPVGQVVMIMEVRTAVSSVAHVIAARSACTNPP